jgi:signal recognition particle subunit SRP54
MTVQDVNSLVNRFEQAAKMMKTVAKGGTPQVPGMPAGLGGVVPRKKAKDKKKGGSKSGNPAKRAAELNAKELGIKPAGSGAGSAFGIGN